MKDKYIVQSVSGVEWGAGWWVRGLLRFSTCELLLLEAGSLVTGTGAGSRYQETGEDTADWEDRSELQGVN
jgi:hypothetical protein